MASANISYKCGYCGWVINSNCENLAEHACFIDLAKHNCRHNIELEADENYVLTLRNMSSSISETTEMPNDQPDNVSLDEMLIAAVSTRRPLWDHTTPLKQRHHLNVKDLWSEVHNVLGGKQSVETLRKRWRQLRDDFMRTNKKYKQYVPSGQEAAARPTKPTFKYYDLMKFLDDAGTETITISNVLPSDSSQTTTSVSSPNLEAPSTSKRKRTESGGTHEAELQKAILETLKEPSRDLDGVDGFGILLCEGLRRLPRPQQAALQITILQLLHSAEESLTTNE